MEQRPQAEAFHRDPAWRSIAEHLPNPATASAAAMEQQADILRARNFPEDALLYYKYALERSPNSEPLQNKLGLTHMQLGHALLARMYFQQLVKAHPGNAEAWNNLGAMEYMEKNYVQAIHDYKRSVKLSSQSAIFRSNLGLAYLSRKDYKHAHEQLDIALRLDPAVFADRSGGGVSAHFISAADHGRFCYEMARSYAQGGNEPEMLHWLAKASQSGIDIMQEMGKDRAMAKYTQDARIAEIVQVANTLHASAPAAPMAVNTSSAVASSSPAIP